MSEQHKVYKPKAISGFPEWLPEYRAVELQWLDKIRAVFESYGFCNIETPSVEEIDALSAKAGETEKEIYTLTRLQEDGVFVKSLYEAFLQAGFTTDAGKQKAAEMLVDFFYGKKSTLSKEDAIQKALQEVETSISTKEARLALHFDLTVPMARYVAQHFGQLVFPFKRYQMQKSWRGERPQKGRYREFYQCDIDVVNIDELPLHFDAELPAVLFEAYQALGIPPVELHISNRKILVGYLQGLGIADTAPVTRALDKLDKIGVEGVSKVLAEEGIAADIAQKALAFVQIKTPDSSFAGKVRALGVQNELMEQGIAELQFVTDNLKHLHGGGMVANLGIIRGLDYYTGTVLEARFKDSAEHWPKGTPALAIGGGGRYDDLAGSFINQKLPGVGLSIGLTRLFGLLMDQGKITALGKSPADVLVVLPDEARRAEAAATARTLRSRGFKVEMYHRDAKIKNQMAYAEKKGIAHVWFPPFKDGQPHEVKNMTSGEQKQADAANWTP